MQDPLSPCKKPSAEEPAIGAPAEHKPAKKAVVWSRSGSHKPRQPNPVPMKQVEEVHQEDQEEEEEDQAEEEEEEWVDEDHRG